MNAARGGLIVEADLISALKSGKLAAAGLDVYPNEPHVSSELRSLPNVFLTPHLGNATVATRNQMGFLILDNFDTFFANQRPSNLVT